MAVQKGAKRGPYNKIVISDDKQTIIREGALKYTPDELAKILNIKSSTIRTFMYKNKIPVKPKEIIEKGKHRRFFSDYQPKTIDRKQFTNYSNKQFEL